MRKGNEMRLILVRHGETDFNSEGRIQGRTAISHLSEKGRKQAVELAERLRRERIDFIYASARHRAMETATEINRWHNLPLHEKEELDEQDMGVLVGHVRGELPPELREIYLRSKTDPVYRIPDGESFNDVTERVRPLLDEIVRQNGTVLVVGCGRMLKAMIHILTGRTFAELMTFWFPNCGIMELEIRDGKTRVLRDEMVPR